MTGEFAFIERIRTAVPTTDGHPVGIGDDAAVLDGGLLLALDTLVDGVHFRLDWCSASDVGWKSVAVNVSDIAAMGGSPTACVIGLTVPANAPDGLADELMAGVMDAASELGAPLVGGDTTNGPTLVISVAILGHIDTGRAPVLRSGAHPGDTVYVTGPLGLATSALDALVLDDLPPSTASADRLHRPWPRLAAGTAAARAGATAMIDISDGLAADLAHICDASGVGVRVETAAVPVAPGISFERALNGGDDYELCFTAPSGAPVAEWFDAAGLPRPTTIGTITASPEERTLVDPDGSTHAMPAAGFEHHI